LTEKAVIKFPGKDPVYAKLNPNGMTGIKSLSAIEEAGVEHEDMAKHPSDPLDFYAVVELLTGNGTVTRRNVTGGGFASWLNPIADSLQTKLANSLANRKVVIAGTNSISDPTLNGLYKGHVYAVLAYDKDNDRIRLRNPQLGKDAKGNDVKNSIGRSLDGYGPGEFWISFKELEENFQVITIEK
jgi:hypothetical protein